MRREELCYLYEKQRATTLFLHFLRMTHAKIIFCNQQACFAYGFLLICLTYGEHNFWRWNVSIAIIEIPDMHLQHVIGLKSLLLMYVEDLNGRCDKSSYVLQVTTSSVIVDSHLLERSVYALDCTPSR